MWLKTWSSPSCSSTPLIIDFSSCNLYAAHHCLSPLLLAHLLVLALLWSQLLQNPTVPDSWQVLPQGALPRWGHWTTPGPRPWATGRPIHGKVHAGFADVAANCLAPDLLGDDGGAVLLVQRLWGWTSETLQINKMKLQFFGLLSLAIVIRHNDVQVMLMEIKTSSSEIYTIIMHGSHCIL